MGARALPTSDVPFWRRKTLDEMTAEEWESLCDGCGRCCLVKLEDEDTGEVYVTSVSCRLLDTSTCRCKSYETRFLAMPDCVSVTPATVRSVDWLPPTCAYRLVEEGRDLHWWHPLVSGDPSTVHAAGIAVGPWVTSEAEVASDSLYRYIIGDFWPVAEPDE
ncbi:MAG: hypothetical protein RLZ98_2066 [Pseudomonadota bacterium]|jgi:uncharacterized cysteine cluster protein YcgN (CxxCxxCC family)